MFTLFREYLVENKIKLASKRSQEERLSKKEIAQAKRNQRYIDFFKKYVDGGSKGDVTPSKIDSRQEKLPDFVKKIGGNFSLKDSDITELPENFLIEGDFYVGNAKIEKLPDGLHVKGNLTIANGYHDEIILGDNTTVDGSIILDVNDVSGDSVLYKIGKNLTVGGDMQVHDHELFSLIDGLHVKGNLDISYVQTSSLPNDLKVEGDLDIRGTGVQNDVVARKQLKYGYVKGKIYW